MKIWPHDTIRELLALADVNGGSRAQLNNECEARRFRYAIYSFRRQHNTGYDLAITLEDSTVILTKKPAPAVSIVA